jgi:hypothetical protein
MADLFPVAPLPDPQEPPPLLPALSDGEINAARGYVEASRAASGPFPTVVSSAAISRFEAAKQAG